MARRIPSDRADIARSLHEVGATVLITDYRSLAPECIVERSVSRAKETREGSWRYRENVNAGTSNDKQSEPLSPKVQGFLRKVNLRRVSRSLKRGRKA